MILDQILQIGAESKFSADGTFIYIDSADGLVEITTDNGRSYQLNHRDQIQVPIGEEFQQIAIRNLHTDANHIVVKTGYGKFYAANDFANTFADVYSIL